MKIKTWFVSFFKCSFVLMVGAVIFELDKVGMSNFVKFEYLGMTLKIERVFEKMNIILSQKLAKWAMNLVSKKDHNQCKICYMRKNTLFCKIKSLYIDIHSSAANWSSEQIFITSIQISLIIFLFFSF